MIKSSKYYIGSGNVHGGCSCHNSKRLRRQNKKTAKARERRVWIKEQLS